MITIFNRKELTVTFDLKTLAEIRSKLAAHNIDYVINPIELQDILNPQRCNIFSEYKIYVKKPDYDFAQAVMNNRVTWDNSVR